MKAYSGSHTQGCHVCGGFPGSLKTPVPKLFQCLKCGFFTCNKHLKGGLSKGCPNCGGAGKDLRGVMTNTSHSRVKAGGMPGHVQAKSQVQKGQHEDEVVSTSSSFGAGSSSSKPGESKSSSANASLAAEEGTSTQKEADIVQRTLDSSLNRKKDSLQQAIESIHTLPTLEKSESVPTEDELFGSDKNLDTPPSFDENASLDDLLNATPLNEDETDAVTSESPFDVEDEDHDESIDLEALEMMDKILKEQEQGLSLTRNLITDAYFRVENNEGLSISEKYLLNDKDGIHLLSVDIANTKNLDDVYKLAKKSPNIFAAVAYSPKSIQDNKLPDLEKLKTLLRKKNKFIAIGETGLDLHFSPHTKALQKQLLVSQIKLAVEYGVPVYLNSKKADAELYEVLNELRKEGLKPTIIITPVVRTVEMFQLVLDHACYLLMRPEITHEHESLYRECLKEIPLDRLLLASGEETSAPSAYAGRWNSPEYIEETIKAGSALFGMDKKEFTRKMANNFNSLFNSDPEAGDDEFDFAPTADTPSLIITEEKLLENDIDEDGDELYIRDIDDRMLVGTVRFDRERRLFIYTPKAGFFGPDKFVYEVTDGRGGSDNATVTINVMRS